MLDVTTSSTDPAARYELPSLEQLAHRPEWMRDALCREYPEVNFFVERGESSDPAKQVCERCAVRAECLEAGATERFGIWGGESARTRRKLVRSVGYDPAA